MSFWEGCRFQLYRTQIEGSVTTAGVGQLADGDRMYILLKYSVFK